LGFDPDAHIDVLPQYNLIYVSVPKCASTTIKAALAALNRKQSPSLGDLHTRRRTGILSPSKVGLSTFYRIATSSDSLRFAFVRNPYTRLVSAWADKFINKPLVFGDIFVETYLQHRLVADVSLPHGRDENLSFAQFAEFASATAHQRLNAHWNLQDDLVDMPGLELNLIGRVESFAEDFRRVLNHTGSAGRPSQFIETRYNTSQHLAWQNYYTPQLAKRVYRAYERDFDRFRYPQMAA
jgi:Sulfotransferase family